MIISNDAANRAAERSGRGVVTVVPITSKDSRAQAEQIRSVAVARLHHRAGTVSRGLLAELDEALRTHLAL